MSGNERRAFIGSKPEGYHLSVYNKEPKTLHELAQIHCGEFFKIHRCVPENGKFKTAGFPDG